MKEKLLTVTSAENPENPFNNKLENLFDSIIAQLKVDKIQLQTNTADKIKKDFYDAIMSEDVPAFLKHGIKTMSSIYLLSILVEYFKILSQKAKFPKKIAFHSCDSRLFIWAVIKDNDDEMENILILAEAEINAKYNISKFTIETNILEESDQINIPPQFKIFPIEKIS